MMMVKQALNARMQVRGLVKGYGACADNRPVQGLRQGLRMKRPVGWVISVCMVFLVSLGGCNLVPDYHRPDFPVAQNWPIGPAYGPALLNDAGKPGVETIGWKAFFHDPVLIRLIEISLRNNRDLRVATENIISQRSAYQYQRGELFPTISGQFSASYATYPGSTLSSSSTTVHWNRLQTGFGISNYQIDLFDHVRSLTEQAFEEYMAQINTRMSVQISLMTQVTNAYLTWIADRESLRVIQGTVENRAKNLDLVSSLLRYGQQTGQARAEAQEAYQQAKSQEMQYTRQVALDMNNLVLLLGTNPPPPLLAQMEQVTSLQQVEPFPPLPQGVPSQLLQRRPDIRAAEHQLLAANANIGYVRSQFYPSILLSTASVGTGGTQFAQFFKKHSLIWQLAPTVSLPIFTAGQNVAGLEQAKAEQRVAVAQYQKAVQTAFREVADALASRHTYSQQIGFDQERVVASHTDYTLSRARFLNGVDSFLNTLVAQNTYLTNQLTLIQSRLQYKNSLSTLYTALGGGWTVSEEMPIPNARAVNDPKGPVQNTATPPQSVKAVDSGLATHGQAVNLQPLTGQKSQ
ncbi:efflux transporter outer membrane subunit [Entomobacter blattae]|uniref:Outer membrane protein OprM n=1 Tax=Entomobacter blattae TaxID=2762277 RepID=A0A7H1NQH2_9PROT|nr:efflux transporter outer membrane subunit [Entomobacter blattae]QNT78032.1 Outer membrane protein OprM [Entomobacter blattae]